MSVSLIIFLVDNLGVRTSQRISVEILRNQTNTHTNWQATKPKYNKRFLVKQQIRVKKLELPPHWKGRWLALISCESSNLWKVFHTVTVWPIASMSDFKYRNWQTISEFSVESVGTHSWNLLKDYVSYWPPVRRRELYNCFVTLECRKKNSNNLFRLSLRILLWWYAWKSAIFAVMAIIAKLHFYLRAIYPKFMICLFDLVLQVYVHFKMKISNCIWLLKPGNMHKWTTNNCKELVLLAK